MDQNTKAKAFIERWQGVTASELATAQSFVMELCELLGVPKPHPTPAQDYMFERPVTFMHGDGSSSSGRIDCYRRGHFVLEAKKLKAGTHTKGFDDGLLRARSQGEAYARALPVADGRPPFVLVVDVGTVIEVYAEFSRTGGTYIPFPDPRSHRIALTDLTDPAKRERLRLIWTNPDALDPARISAKVTREVSERLAELARSLEQAGHASHDVAAYLSRCLFSMFAEDVGLLPEGSFLGLLKQHRDDPATLQQMLRILWADMDKGGFSAALVKQVLRFNGKLFKGASTDAYSLPLTSEHIDLLILAARANWREVEPAIFGTLLERALDPTERHALGAHYTPRAYVERLVVPTVIGPLRAEWADAQAAALLLAHEAAELEAHPPEVKTKKDFTALNKHSATVRAKWNDARQQVRDFLHRLCTLRVLDPACGSGNFLYVTLEHLKRLEGEVLNQLATLGDTQTALDLGRETVTLRQLLGIELNERAATLAELVLWIGYLQWHIRTNGNSAVAEPVVHDYGNIEHRDAVLEYDRREHVVDAHGQVMTRWDGVTMKLHSVTGQEVPDESAQVVQWRYLNPRKASWPAADFIVGNPPFIGNKRMRTMLGDGYVDALRSAWPDVPESADFVMYWWQQAAETVRKGNAQRFGLITTNSLTMIFNRRVIEAHQTATPPLSLAFGVPDHPWVDSADGAAVRIAMSVGVAGVAEGQLCVVTEEVEAENGEVAVQLSTRQGMIHADLTVGANVAGAKRLQANSLLSNRGVIPHGAGFIVTPDEAAALGLGSVPGLEQHIRPYRNGRDLTGSPRGVYIIDLYGLSADDTRSRFPSVYQRLLERVKPERDHNPRPKRREFWWRFAEDQPRMRASVANLPRYIVTGQVAKHRVFQFLDTSILPDDKLIVIASADALHLGVLSSSVHVQWALATGGTLEDRPVYSKSICFEAFPFPDIDTGITPELAERIRHLAEQLDAHRKAQQTAHAEATVTASYNVLEKLRLNEALTAKEKVVYERGLVGVLKSLHDELDNAVLQAYGWSDLQLPADTDMLLERLVTLNSARAVEEATGTVRWLRPEFQRSQGQDEQIAIEVDTESEADEEIEDATYVKANALMRRPWPAGVTEQIKAVADVLAQSAAGLDRDAVAAHFSGRGRWRDRLPTLLETLAALGRARVSPDGRWTDAGRSI
ncbi:class I SAM-dependent DNA methyltransferase [Burkholderia multivorans]|uniref:class I SAM-dependent DNA methyltransferase n=1 Tax=Burkholderia multivorans TaxID=87883 RepID=UPI0019085CBD|nr:class I SAM-dependent DNA methyltransferase [Burkholderia multivorans]MBJ9654713.1 class I SAM-dependent DNA methyltransferase [Burkholderia multivorans]MBR8048727.1 class I SAM-dependent DNA methyltransferase [Burkholderia multivorans]MBU9528740.1 class I SAM-dependent DNA methyltransferase [Burkholderia multivorans]MCO1359402.1 class I SAM-dependent DNA methyltransferase [Burkholderia multivorans]MCO1419163.1 class I SAM-dependent DNA methyltransferase [Burkholderia multivorans]